MGTKKRNSVFFQADLSHGWFVREKTKNENLIVVAGCGEKHFSFFEFPDFLFNMEFDPEYAERVTNCSNGAFSLVGWPESDGDFHPIYFRAYLATLQNFVFVQNVRLPIGDAAFAYDGLLPLPDGSVYSLRPWDAFERLEDVIDAAVKRRDALERSADWTARMNTESKAEVEKRFGVDLQKRWKDKGRGIPEINPMPEPAEVSSPSPVSPPRTPYELDTATGKVPIVAPDVSLPPGFVAVPLPDDGEPVLGYKRKPGHYLTRGGYFVDLTYNVGTGIDQHPFPWVHFDKHRRGNYYDVFLTENGEAYRVTRVGASESKFSLCHYDHLPDYDIVQKCVHPAAEELRNGPKVEVKEEVQDGDVPVEHYNHTTEQFSKFRGEVGEAFALLAKAFGVCDCRCAREGGEAANHAREGLESKLSESRAEVHALNKRIAELARALGSEKQVSVELDAKCDRLTEQWVGIVEIVEKLTDERDAARSELSGVLKELADVKVRQWKQGAAIDNGDGTVTALKPVTYPKGLDVEQVREPRLGDEFISDIGEQMTCTLSPRNEGRIRLILRPAPKPPEPVTWEAGLADGEWEASLNGVENDTVLFQWEFWGKLLHGLAKPPKLGKYRFENGVGTLVKAADDSGKEGS